MPNKLKIGIIGLGNRGTGLLEGVMLPMTEDKFDILAVCDLYEDRVVKAADSIEKTTNKRPIYTTDYKDILKMPEIDAVVISAAWEAHIDITIDAMEAGKFVALEVGGAYTMHECWRLIDTYEKTHTEVMLLENCCFGKRELMALNMVRQGLFGKVSHCAGGYLHDLRSEIITGKESRHYRLRNYINRNCENYPTHEIGPIAKLLNINNGNRFTSLVSVSSCSHGLHEYAVETKGADHPLSNINFNQGDVITTVIKCANGETVTITLDTTLSRSYSRGFTVRGTKGSYFEDSDMIFLDSEHKEYEFNAKPLWGNAEKYEEKYNHPIWKDFIPKGGHDGMDWLTFEAFYDAAINHKHPPIDVYDTATYMCITTLSEQSIATGSMPVAIPDFTHGKWYNRTDIEDGPYCLDIIDINKELY